jgi:hypothetical protein
MLPTRATAAYRCWRPRTSRGEGGQRTAGLDEGRCSHFCPTGLAISPAYVTCTLVEGKRSLKTE